MKIESREKSAVALICVAGFKQKEKGPIWGVCFLSLILQWWHYKKNLDSIVLKWNQNQPPHGKGRKEGKQNGGSDEDDMMKTKPKKQEKGVAFLTIFGGMWLSKEGKKVCCFLIVWRGGNK